MVIRIGLLAGWLACALTSQGQFAMSYGAEIPLRAEGRQLAMPWAGGINSAQMGMLDLNGDRKPDMVVFDKSAEVFLPYLCQGDGFIFAPDFQGAFPPDIKGWALLRDFNGDGQADIFTSDPFGIRVFVNVTSPIDHMPRWRPFNGGDPLLSSVRGREINIQINATDVPSIEDIDGDGDLDIVLTPFSGTGAFDLYLNESKEATGGYDTLAYVLSTNYWGKFLECGCGSFAYAPKDCFGGGRLSHLAGKSLLTTDMNGDGSPDLLFSESSCNDLYILFNGESSGVSATMRRSSTFSLDGGEHFPLFPTPYRVDVDADGVPDLMVSSNALADVEAIGPDFRKTMYWLRNTGSAEKPAYTLQQKDFLQRDMVDVGAFSAPAFYDMDGDGDEDLIVAGNDLSVGSSTLWYFENKGNSVSPDFEQISTDLFSLSKLGLLFINPQFVYVNGDRHKDLAWTAWHAATRKMRLYYMLYSPEKGTFLQDQIQNVAANLSLRQGESVLLIDYDKDGKTDILIGKGNGAVQSWRNVSDGFSDFQLTDSQFLGLGNAIQRSYPTLFAYDFTQDGEDDLVVSQANRTLWLYKNYLSGKALSVDSIVVYNNLRKQERAFAGSPAPHLSAGKLFGGKKLTLAVGSVLGGIFLLEAPLQETPSTGQRDNAPLLFPNPIPSGERLYIYSKTATTANVEFINPLGKIIKTFKVDSHTDGTIQSLLLEGIARGVYYVRITDATGKQSAVRIVIL